MRYPSSSPAMADRPMADLNITPLIDVMLVPLIMFIITIPAATQVLPLTLSVGEASAVPVDATKNEVAIDADGGVTWNGRSVSDDALRGLLARSMTLPVEPELHLRPAAGARYDVVDRVLTVIKQAHVIRLGFIGNERFSHAF